MSELSSFAVTAKPSAAVTFSLVQTVSPETLSAQPTVTAPLTSMAAAPSVLMLRLPSPEKLSAEPSSATMPSVPEVTMEHSPTTIISRSPPPKLMMGAV